jgi:cysteine desulfurase / selenocysteine lyase
VLGAAPDADRAALISMTLRGCDDLSDVARMLSDSYGVMCRSGHLCAQPLVDAMCEGEILRASAYIYNTEDEVYLLFRALDEIYESLGL